MCRSERKLSFKLRLDVRGHHFGASDHAKESVEWVYLAPQFKCSGVSNVPAQPKQVIEGSRNGYGRCGLKRFKSLIDQRIS